jgi:iron(III) transport system permease protein
LSSALILEATARSVALGLAVALLSGAAGVTMAWLVSRADLPGRAALAGLLSVPYAIPAYLLGMAWVVLANPTVGLLRDWMPSAYGFWGMALVEASVAFAFPFLELRAGFARLDPALEEAARMSGAGPWRVFRDVSLPLLWPALVNGMCLAFLYALAAFGVPAILGLPVREFVLTTVIYSQLKMGGEAGLASGIRLSLLLLVIAGVVVLISSRLSAAQRRRGGAIGGAKSSRPSFVRLGPWKYPAAAASWGFFAVAVVLPWIALGLSALAPVAGRYSPSLWTGRNLSYLIGLPDFREGLVNSLLLSTAVATGVVAAGFLLGFASVRRGRRWASWTIDALGLPFATPGSVIAIALILLSTWAALGLGQLGLSLDFPLVLMAAAYGLKYSAVGARGLATAYHQVHPHLEEAARMSGARTRELLTTIWLPLLRRSLFAAWLLALLPMLTELTMSVLLTGPGAATLGTVLFQLQEYADQPTAAAMAWMLLTVAIAVGLLTRRSSPE